jgi:hypothetical protein
MRPEGRRQSGAYGWLPSYRPGPRMTERAYPTSRHSELRCSDKCLRWLAKDIRERAHGWVAATAERQGTEDDVGLLRRLVPRCVRRPDVQLCDPDGDLAVGIVARRGRPHRHRDAADLVPGGMVLRDPGRKVWPGKNAPDHHPLVLVLHLPVRLRDLFRDVVRLARAPRSGVRRRLGRRCGADGRGCARQVSRPRRRSGADRLGGRLGRCRHRLYRALLDAAGIHRLAGAVRDRLVARGLCVLGPASHR